MDTFRPSATIDWLAFTIHWNQEPLQRFRKAFNLERIAAALTNQAGAWLVQAGRQHYPLVVSSALNTGLCVMATEPDHAMGVHVSWSGSSLGNVSPRSVLRTALAMGANVTRIDIAIDVYHEMYLRSMKAAADQGEIVTRAQDWPLIEGRTGSTLYVGSRTSEKFLRIYDKAAEQKAEGPWYRIELECKGDFARGVALHVDGNGYEYFGDIIRGFADWPTMHQWQEATTSPTLLEGIPRPEKRRDTFAWLMKSVAPSVAKLLVEDHEKFVTFLRSVYTHAGVESGVGEADPFDGQADWEPRSRR